MSQFLLLREETLARQLKLGVIPEGTKLAPKPPAVRDWESLSGDEIRGRVLGTANGVSFVMGAVGSGLFYLLRQLGMPSNRVFLVLAVLCLAMAWVSSRWLRRLSGAAGTGNSGIVEVP